VVAFACSWAAGTCVLTFFFFASGVHGCMSWLDFGPDKTWPFLFGIFRVRSKSGERFQIVSLLSFFKQNRRGWHYCDFIETTRVQNLGNGDIKNWKTEVTKICFPSMLIHFQKDLGFPCSIPVTGWLYIFQHLEEYCRKSIHYDTSKCSKSRSYRFVGHKGAETSLAFTWQCPQSFGLISTLYYMHVRQRVKPMHSC
jgi:hypothetical protein